MSADDSLLYAERRRLERAILAERDSMRGVCTTSYPSFPASFIRPIQFPDQMSLGFYHQCEKFGVHRASISSTIWHLGGSHKTSDCGAEGLFLRPSGKQFLSNEYSHDCMLGRVLSNVTPSWYGSWAVIPSHFYVKGASEWLEGILAAYEPMLEKVGIRYAVTVAMFEYPQHFGLLQALTERFDRRWNTFATASGEVSLDLWSFQRISGLPICGNAYEEICLDDLHMCATDGNGTYQISHHYRFLMKVWRDLALAEKDSTPRTPRVSLAAWVSFFYNGPFCFYNNFAQYGVPWRQQTEIIMEQEKSSRHLPASSPGWHADEIDPLAYLAAYLAYWLDTFVMPHGERGILRAEVLYPACAMASGQRLALAPAALANIYHSLGSLTSHPCPRSKGIILPTHYLSAWAGLLFPSLSSRIGNDRPAAPLLFNWVPAQ